MAMLELRDCEQCTGCDLALTRERVVISRGAATAPLMLSLIHISEPTRPY